MGAWTSGQPTSYYCSHFCIHCGRGEAAGSCTHPQSREASGIDTGNVGFEMYSCMLCLEVRMRQMDVICVISQHSNDTDIVVCVTLVEVY